MPLSRSNRLWQRIAYYMASAAALIMRLFYFYVSLQFRFSE